VLAAGAVAVGAAALPYKLFELDRFFVAKEIALQLAAAAALVATARTGTRASAREPSARPDLVDVLLGVFVAVSTASAILAPSGWLAGRAVAVSLAGAALFWSARAAARAGLATAALRAAALVTLVAALGALARRTGCGRSTSASTARPAAPSATATSWRTCASSPSGAGLPRPPRPARARRGRPHGGVRGGRRHAGAHRSRGAWLATAVAAAPLTLGIVRAAAARHVEPGTPARTGRARPARAAVLVAAAAAAALGAVRIPNALDWRSESPYLDSARDVVNYREGSGQGRLRQWRNSARLVAERPLLGVGPGNWPVRYPAAAPPRDPSLSSERTTANPWPSSDWVAIASERGLVALAALALAFALLFRHAHRLVWHARSADDRLRGGVLGAVLAATVTAGAFDAVLLLAAPTFVAWTAAGALAGAAEPPAAARPGTRAARTVGPDSGSPAGRGAAGRLVALALAAVLAAAACLGIAHGAAMALASTGSAGHLHLAARLAPGDYRIQLRAAQAAQRAGRCGAARERAAAARRMAPAAAAPERVLRACQGARRRAGGG
jgi:hypothetical protein